jgi:two-component system, sensor histidine kinase and response regulator
MIVDDNATNRKVIMGQLLLCGAEPVSASSANEALALMRQARAAGRPYEVALLDHQMPGIDGAELGRSIVQDAQLKVTRLVLLTSSGQRGDGQLFADIGLLCRRPDHCRTLSEQQCCHNRGSAAQSGGAGEHR